MKCSLLKPKPGTCDWCNKPLQGKQSRWCSKKCSSQNTANHRWTQAKRFIKKQRAHYQCEHCNNWFPDNEIEVDHIKPCKGRHGQWGCWHHQTNLRLLCKPCHKTRTRQQHQKGQLK